MDEIEIIQIPCDSIGEKQAKLIEALLEIAKALNITGESVKTDQSQEAA
ncbi:MAG TPA: hypothetical protein PKC28_06590 [Bdellovibrionales bacterium]|nr:hypothetical protein [Bdellovibrionales bacterium]